MLFRPSTMYKAKGMGRITALKLQLYPMLMIRHYYDHLYTMRKGWKKPSIDAKFYSFKRRVIEEYCCPLCDYRRTVKERKGHLTTERGLRYGKDHRYYHYINHGPRGLRPVSEWKEH